MKNFTFTASLLLISMIGFAQTTLCPSFFRRNNGNGACPEGQLKLYFTTCPVNPPIIDSVYTNGVRAAVTFSAPDASRCASLGYISYCVSGGNMPPAAMWQIFFHNTGSTNSYGCLVPEGGILPINIHSFSARRNVQKVLLNWATSFESHALGFEVQRKEGNDFVTIASIAAKNYSSGSSYSYIDERPQKGVLEYRLKLTARDAGTSYSATRIVNREVNETAFKIFPNPALHNSKIIVKDMGDATDLQVIDCLGRIIQTIKTNASNRVEINGLNTGIYRIRMINKVSGITTAGSLTVMP